jgi:nucleoside-diphosphate-sugar epimerase
MARILIAGCGYVGNALASRLLSAGHKVWGLRRRVEELVDGVEPLPIDLSQAITPSSLPPQLDVVFYTAAAGSFDEAAYKCAYHDALLHLVDALQASHQSPQRFIFTSSTSVYHQQDGAWVNESSDLQPENFSGQWVLAGEKCVGNLPWRGVSVRFGGIYGPERQGIVQSVRGQQARLMPGPPVYTNRIHRDDCVGVLLHVMNLHNPKPSYVAVDDEPTPYNDVLTWMAKSLALPPPKSGAARRQTNKRCSNRALKESGYTFVYPTFREGYTAIIKA